MLHPVHPECCVVGSLHPELRLAFQRQVCQTHRTHRTQGTICPDGVDSWASFNSAQGFKLASWFIDGKVSKTQINDDFSGSLGNPESVGYSSMHTLENLLQFLDSYTQYLHWFEGQVEDGQGTLLFFYWHVLGCVRYLLRQIIYRDDLV